MRFKADDGKMRILTIDGEMMVSPMEAEMGVMQLVGTSGSGESTWNTIKGKPFDRIGKNLIVDNGALSVDVS